MHPNIVKTFNVFLNFCYIACQNVLTDNSLNTLNVMLGWFYHYCEIFQTSGVWPDGFSLPHQYALKHYCQHIKNFGAPNSLCSSITKSKHIVAVKKLWHQLSHHEALGQMLIINTQNNKLAAARANFTSQGTLHGTCLGEAIQELHRKLSADGSSDLSNEDKTNGPDGNGKPGGDLDLEHNNEDNGAPGPVDGPAIFSKVILAHKKGIHLALPPSLCRANYFS